VQRPGKPLIFEPTPRRDANWTSGSLAKLDAEMEHQTARDTTTGSPKPMGSRGATMADIVGPARSA
jgi:hypothetical protein